MEYAEDGCAFAATAKPTISFTRLKKTVLRKRPATRTDEAERTVTRNMSVKFSNNAFKVSLNIFTTEKSFIAHLKRRSKALKPDFRIRYKSDAIYKNLKQFQLLKQRKPVFEKVRQFVQFNIRKTAFNVIGIALNNPPFGKQDALQSIFKLKLFSL